MGKWTINRAFVLSDASPQDGRGPRFRPGTSGRPPRVTCRSIKSRSGFLHTWDFAASCLRIHSLAGVLTVVVPPRRNSASLFIADV